MRYVLGPLIIIASIAMMKYTVQITNVTGKMEFAERYLQYPLAGTYSFYRILGVICIILALIWIFGLVDFGSSALVSS